MRSLEDNPLFDAGHGSVLNKAGEIEMDAIIVDGGELLEHEPCHSSNLLSLLLVA